MNSLKDYLRQKKFFEQGVAHATLDPKGPGAVTLHLVPPPPSLFKDPPSLLIIDGMYFLTVGPSWAANLRIFLSELTSRHGSGKELNKEDVEVIEEAVAKKVMKLYPKANRKKILEDLKEIVTLSISIAKGWPVPPEIESGMLIKQYAKYMTAPHRMDLIVSPMSLNRKRRCPLNCKNCYAEQPSMNIEEELTTQEWMTIIKKCKNANIPMITFTGGEPLMRSDIVNLVNYSKWFITRMNTNGYLLTADLAKKLFEASLDSIQITLYSNDPAIHDSLVEKTGAWERTVEGIKNALDAGLSVSVNTPLVGQNSDYCETLKFLYEIGVRCVTCSGLIATGGAKQQIKNGKDLDADSLQALLSKATKVCEDLGMEISFTSPGCLPSEEILKMGFHSSPVCGACLSNMAIDPKGNVVPCQSWLNGENAGNMITDDWSKIWNNPLCKKIRRDCATKPQCPLKKGGI